MRDNRRRDLIWSSLIDCSEYRIPVLAWTSLVCLKDFLCLVVLYTHWSCSDRPFSGSSCRVVTDLIGVEPYWKFYFSIMDEGLVSK